MGGVRRGRGLAGGLTNGPEELEGRSHPPPPASAPHGGVGGVRKVGFEGRGARSKPVGGGLSVRGRWGRSCEDPEPHGLAAWWEQERPWDTGSGVRSEHMFPAPARRLSAGHLERRSWAGRNSDGRAGLRFRSSVRTPACRLQSAWFCALLVRGWKLSGREGAGFRPGPGSIPHFIPGLSTWASGLCHTSQPVLRRGQSTYTALHLLRTGDPRTTQL